MTAVTEKVLACPTGGFVGTVKVKVIVAPDGSVTTAAPSTSAPHIRSAPFPPTLRGGSFSYPFVYESVAACDADVLRQKGDDHLATGMDAAALAAFESSLRCRPDPALIPKAYMAACRSKNAATAQKYYLLLPGASRSSLLQICNRQGISLREPAPIATGGVIKISSMPSARILLDGVDTGKNTPATLNTTAGAHKVTFVIGDNKYTFKANVRAGETLQLSKDFQ